MIRRLVVVALLVLAACSDAEDGDDVGAPTATTPSTAPSVPTTAAGGDGGSGPGQPGGEGAPPATVASGLEVPSTTGAPGSAASFYLRPQPARSIVVELAAEAGAEPAAAAVDHLRSTLSEVAAKPVSVTSVAAPSARETWSAADLRAAADDVAVASQGDPAVLRVLFVHGSWAESDTVLGVAVRGDTVAIFADAIDRSASPIVGRDAIETAVLTHELGHVLGLVDLHRDTGRDDPEHPGHSTSRASVMYWAVESTLVADLLTGGPPRDFDAADLADLAAIRAGA